MITLDEFRNLKVGDKVRLYTYTKNTHPANWSTEMLLVSGEVVTIKDFRNCGRGICHFIIEELEDPWLFWYGNIYEIDKPVKKEPAPLTVKVDKPKKPAVSVHKIINDAMKKKDRYVSLFIGPYGTSVSVYPYSDEEKDYNPVAEAYAKVSSVLSDNIYGKSTRDVRMSLEEALNYLKEALVE